MSELDRLDSDALAVVDETPLSEDEAAYVDAARAANTLRGYRSDWREWATWCGDNGHRAFPATAAGISRYLTFLAGHGAKVGTMSRRLSAIRLAHRLRNQPDPTEHARIVAVWEGIRRTHGTPPDQAAPLMPPELFHVLDACPLEKRWKTRGRPPEPDLAGHRDRALLLVGFVTALRRSELAALTIDQVNEHPNGLVAGEAASTGGHHVGRHDHAPHPRKQAGSRGPTLAGRGDGPTCWPPRSRRQGRPPRLEHT